MDRRPSPHPARSGVARAGVVALFVAAFALAVGLRLEQAGSSLAFDEYASLYFSDHRLGQLWGWWLARETNPPLFYSLLKLWRMVVPFEPEALRALPLAISLAQIGMAGWYARRVWGWRAALVCVLLLALSPSDIYQSPYLRGYGLAKLATTMSFIGLAEASRGRRGGLWLYAGGAIVAVYCHTTMLLWPLVASFAVVAQAPAARGPGRGLVLRLLLANLAILMASGWELAVVAEQMHGRTGNIAWIKPLDMADFFATAKLQLLQAGWWTSALMLGLIGAGVARTWQIAETRMAFAVLVGGLVLFKAADAIHPVITDFTLHWLATFAAWLAGAALTPGRGRRPRIAERAVAAAIPVVALALGLVERAEDDAIPHPQDWRVVVDAPGPSGQAALLVAHESIAVIVTEACRLRFHRPDCPFPLVAMRNPSASDSWASGGYRGAMVAPAEVRGALATARARTVFAFSRYVYTPLAPLGLDKGDYREIEWDDGELIGPIPVEDFSQPLPPPGAIAPTGDE
ncbi:MAG: hypothetical protein KGM17_13480 [Sphingomonadales bacterium]|nr:hypothetical protein [Sphingomonadales bacterium]